MADRLAENGAIQYSLANPEAGSKRAALSGYIMGALTDWLRSPFPPSSRLAAPGRLRGKFFDSGIAPLAMDFTSGQYASGSAGTMAMKSFSDIITFSRTSNATITKSDGTIGYAPHNLLVNSESFDSSSWTKAASTTITANSIVSPDGSITADTITPNTTNAAHVVSRTAGVSGTNTISCYAKTNGYNFLRLRFGGSTLKNAYFNISTGALGTVDSGVTATITALSNGWYRCSTTFSVVSTGDPVVIGVSETDNVESFAGNGTSGLYIWGAQLEIGSTATTYNSTTVKNLLGFTESYENAAWTKSNSFVQSNLLTFSEAFDNAAWTKSNSTITANTVIAPNGYQTADKIIEGATIGSHYVFQNVTTLASNYSFSVYFKKAERKYVMLYHVQSNAGSIFDLDTAAVSLPSGGITAPVSSSCISVGNGWYRCTIIVTATAAANGFRIYTSDSSTTFSYTGDGTSGLYSWGAQLVQGSTAGDYRRTDAAALPVFYPNHNGVVCAEKLVENTAASTSHRIIQAASGLVSFTLYTISIYAKKGERSVIYIQDGGASGTNEFSFFNLNTGVATKATGASHISVSITPVGDGWYRCGLVYQIPAAVTAISWIVGTATSADIASVNYTGDGTSGIYIFGAQLSDSASLDPYVLNAGAAPSAQAYYGARFDYDPVTLAPKGLLIEEQRSNLLLQSEAFNTTWTLTGCKAFGSGSTVNATTSPDGTVSADLITPTAGSAHYVIQTATVASGASYTATIYAKPAGYTWILLWSNTASAGAYFDVANGVIGTVSSGVTATITKVANGFYRCSITRTTASTSEAVACFVAQSNGVFSYTSDETSGMYLWGAQLEAGAFATSYIPTAASSVTRAADVAVIQGSNFYSFYNQNEGSSYVQAQSYMSTGALTYTQYNDGTVNNIIRQYASTAVYGIQVQYNSSSAAQIATGGGSINLNKIIGTYKVNDFAAAQNNVLGTPDTSGDVPIVNRLSIGATATPNLYINGTIKQISYYNTRLPNATLQGLTA